MIILSKYCGWAGIFYYYFFLCKDRVLARYLIQKFTKHNVRVIEKSMQATNKDQITTIICLKIGRTFNLHFLELRTMHNGRGTDHRPRFTCCSMNWSAVRQASVFRFFYAIYTICYFLFGSYQHCSAPVNCIQFLGERKEMDPVVDSYS